jgi:hypothetical protein
MSRGRSTSEYWGFGSANREIIVSGAEHLLTHLSFFLTGWSFRHLENGDASAVDIQIDFLLGQRSTLTIASSTSPPEEFDDPFDAAEYFAELLASSYPRSITDSLCLRSSGTIINKKALIFLTGSDREHKQIALKLAALGHRLLGDENVIISQNGDNPAAAICLGLAPWIQLPLPKTIDRNFEEFLDTFTEMKRHGRAYLKLLDREAAAFEDEVRVYGFICLENSNAAESSITELNGKDLVPVLLENCVGTSLDQHDLCKKIEKILGSTRCFRLRYNTFDQGARAAINLVQSDA